MASQPGPIQQPQKLTSPKSVPDSPQPHHPQQNMVQDKPEKPNLPPLRNPNPPRLYTQLLPG